MTIDQMKQYFGSNKAAARRLGIHQSAISMWRSRGGVIPLPVQWQLRLGMLEDLAATDKVLAKRLAEVLPADETALLP
jgi:DNA-binding transcriptional regulator YdaS (Cro superfamily)